MLINTGNYLAAITLPVKQMSVALNATHGDVFNYEFYQTTEHDELHIKGFYPVAGEARFKLKVKVVFSVKIKTI